jgi:hypothetical protein
MTPPGAGGAPTIATGKPRRADGPCPEIVVPCNGEKWIWA